MTRDDIKRACEAVGWEAEYREADGTLAFFNPHQRFSDKCFDDRDADALALLEDWRLGDVERRRYQIDSPSCGGDTFGVDLMDGEVSDEAWGISLPEAAVRAVLAWKDGDRD